MRYSLSLPLSLFLNKSRQVRSLRKAWTGRKFRSRCGRSRISTASHSVRVHRVYIYSELVHLTEEQNESKLHLLGRRSCFPFHLIIALFLVTYFARNTRFSVRSFHVSHKHALYIHGGGPLSRHLSPLSLRRQVRRGFP